MGCALSHVGVWRRIEAAHPGPGPSPNPSPSPDRSRSPNPNPAPIPTPSPNPNPNPSPTLTLALYGPHANQAAAAPAAVVIEDDVVFAPGFTTLLRAALDEVRLRVRVQASD